MGENDCRVSFGTGNLCRWHYFWANRVVGRAPGLGDRARGLLHLACGADRQSAGEVGEVDGCWARRRTAGISVKLRTGVLAEQPACNREAANSAAGDDYLYSALQARQLEYGHGAGPDVVGKFRTWT